MLGGLPVCQKDSGSRFVEVAHAALSRLPPLPINQKMTSGSLKTKVGLAPALVEVEKGAGFDGY